MKYLVLFYFIALLLTACSAPPKEMPMFKPCDPCIIENPTTLEVESSPAPISIFTYNGKHKPRGLVLDVFPASQPFEAGDTIYFQAPRTAIYQLHVDITL